jgi:peptidoglycan/LPS O-acetylase OafA/YrhL
VVGHLFQDFGLTASYHAIPAMDIFFAMSGFLITSLLVAEYERNAAPSGKRKRRRAGTISLRNFYERRAWRILPAGLVTIAVTLLVSKLAFNALRFSEVQADALWATFWTENFNLISKSADYFAMGTVESPFQHYWSLAVEEQFYFFWPAIFLLATKLTFLRKKPLMAGGTWANRVVAVAALIGVASFVICVLSSYANPAAAYFSTINRVWILLLGAIAATIPSLRGGLSGRMSRFASWTGAALIATGLMVANQGVPYPGVIGLLPAVGTVLILLAGVREDAPRTAVKTLLETRPIRFIGRISYSLYLWHWPLIVFAAALIPRAELSGIPRVLALGSVSILIAWLSFRFIEVPFMMVKRTYNSGKDPNGKWVGSARTKMNLATLGLAAVLTVGTIAAFARPGNGDDFAPSQAVAAYANGSALKNGEPTLPEGLTTIDPNWQSKILEGLEQTKATPEQAKLLAKPSKLGADHACFNILSNADADRCTLQGRGRSKLVWPESVPKRVVLLGHSIAAEFRESLADVLPKDVTLIPLTLVGCQPSVRAEDRVILGAGRDCGAHNVAANRAISERIHPGMIIFALVLDGDSMSARNVEFARRIKSMSRVQVMIQQAPPTPPFEECLEPDGNIEKCKVPVSRGSSVLKTLAEQRLFAATYKFAPMSLTRLICANQLCPAMIDGYPVRWDGTHLTTEMARRLEPQFAESIAQALESAD